MYLRALSEGIVQIESDDMITREQLQAELDQHGADYLFDRLMEIDPLEAAKIHPNNSVRVIRALEIYRLTGKTKSELVSSGAYRTSGYQFRYYCLQPERERLYGIVEARVDQMLEQGLVDEVSRLVDEGMTKQVRRANVIGYNEILDYLDGRWTLPEAVSMIKQNSRRYAKRQMTWFRHQADCLFFDESSKLIVGITKG